MIRFLLDTNCFIQIVRGRPDAPQVIALLQEVSADRLSITDYAVHSIGVVLSRFGEIGRYEAFLEETNIGRRGLEVIGIPTDRLGLVATACSDLHLDFDDAYQYVAAELHGLSLVSLDADFDRTPLGRLTPAAALQRFKDEQQQPQQDA